MADLSDFDDQWKESRREGLKKSALGQGAWATDAALRKARSTPQPEQTGPRHAASDSCLVALGFLGGLGWAVSEAAGRILS